MDLSTHFVATSASVGIIPMLTEYSLIVATFGFAAMFVFSLYTKDLVAFEHRGARIMSAVICGVAGISYFLIFRNYHAMLETFAHLTSPDERHKLMLQSFSAVGQFRYMDWIITTPLLLLETCLILRVKPREIKGALATMLIADVLMVLTGYIGEQQLSSTGDILQTAKGNWGIISTIFYAVIPIVLYTQIAKFKSRANPDERRAFSIVAATTWTTWGIYPIGYALTTFAADFDPNFLHITFTIADMANKIGVGIVLYLASGASEVISAKSPSRMNG